jgi:hypothetical protein
MKGNPADTPGRVTMLCHKFHGKHVDDLVNICDYNGGLYLTARCRSPIRRMRRRSPAGRWRA